MALDELLRTLRQEAEAEVAAIRAAAQTEADAIRARNAIDLGRRRDALAAERERERRSAVELALSAARREARRAVLEARERLLVRVFASAHGRFAGALGTDAYRAGLPALLEEGLAALGDRRGTLTAHPLALGALAPMVDAARLTAVADPATGAGFRITSADGAVEINATLEDRLTRLEQRLRQEVIAALEPSP